MRYYKVNDKPNLMTEYELIKELTDDYSQFESEERTDEFIDECYEVYKIGTLTFSPSEILKKCDPVAYLEEVQYNADLYQQDLLEEIRQNIINLDKNEEYFIKDIQLSIVYIYDDDEIEGLEDEIFTELIAKE